MRVGINYYWGYFAYMKDAQRLVNKETKDSERRTFQITSERNVKKQKEYL